MFDKLLLLINKMLKIPPKVKLNKQRHQHIGVFNCKFYCTYTLKFKHFMLNKTTMFMLYYTLKLDINPHLIFTQQFMKIQPKIQPINQDQALLIQSV